MPGAPVQTKYPPLYSALLSLLSVGGADVTESARPYKILSVASLALIVLLAGRFARPLLRHPASTVCFALLVGLSPLVFPFADYVLTELPFLATCVAAWCLASSSVELGHDSPGSWWPPPPADLRRALALGLVCGAAFLFRAAALPLVLAGLCVFGIARDRRGALAFVGGAAALAGPWILYKALAAQPAPNPLIAYYTSYEPSVVEIGLEDPRLAAQIVLANVYYLWSALDLATYGPNFPALRLLTYPLLALGLWRIFRRPLAFFPIFVILYAGLLVLWPWYPARYAVPLAPLVPLAWFLGIEWLGDRLASGKEEEARGFRVATRALAAAPALLMLGLALRWVAVYAPTEEDRVRGAFLARYDYAWAGFEETARWIDANAPADAVLASAYDPFYFLSTGRPGIRPWFHRPWTYFYPLGPPSPDLGTAEEIQPALDALGVSLLVVDPLDGYVEGEAIFALYDALLARYTPPVYADTARLRFESRDGLHRVYELPRPATGSETGELRRP